MSTSDSDPGSGHERRVHERFEVMAKISMSHGGAVAELKTSNISAGGIGIQLAPGEYPGVQLGTRVIVHLDLGSDQYGRPLDFDAEAEVVRIDLGGPGRSPGFALMWTSTDASVAKQLSVILEFVHG